MKKETIEEAAERFSKYTNTLGINNDRYDGFIAGDKHRQEISYSEEEVVKLFKSYQNKFPLHRGIQVLDYEFEEWFNQFKK